MKATILFSRRDDHQARFSFEHLTDEVDTLVALISNTIFKAKIQLLANKIKLKN